MSDVKWDVEVVKLHLRAVNPFNISSFKISCSVEKQFQMFL